MIIIMHVGVEHNLHVLTTFVKHTNTRISNDDIIRENYEVECFGFVIFLTQQAGCLGVLFYVPTFLGHVLFILFQLDIQVL